MPKKCHFRQSLGLTLWNEWPQASKRRQRYPLWMDQIICILFGTMMPALSKSSFEAFFACNMISPSSTFKIFFSFMIHFPLQMTETIFSVRMLYTRPDMLQNNKQKNTFLCRGHWQHNDKELFCKTQRQSHLYFYNLHTVILWDLE